MRSLIKYVVIIVAAGLIIWAFQKNNWLPVFKNIFKSQPVLIEETPIIIKEINSLAQLITITYTDEIVMDTAKIGNGMPNLLPTNLGTLLTPEWDRLIIIGRGKVLAGTNLQLLDEKNIHITGDSIHITIPRAVILQTIVNPSNFEIFTEEGSWNENAVTALKIKIRERIKQNAIAQNILVKANARSKNIIETFLRNTGFKKVSVQIN